MQISTVIVTFSMLAIAASSPMPKKATKEASNSTSVLTSSAYNNFQISSGVAGTAASEASALFANINMSNLAGVSAADLEIIGNTHDVAEDAEVQAFNPAIEAATGDEAIALQNGKIKNKVLKLTAAVLAIQVEVAQGGDGSKLAAEQKKLANNIALDSKAAGQPSKAVELDGTT